MSDRETIFTRLEQAESRIRFNQVLGRIALGLSVWVGLAILVNIWNLVSPLSPLLIWAFWLIWFAGLAVWVAPSFKIPHNLARTAASVDKKARLEDEVLSAYWFLNQEARTPWVELQIHRAAETIRRLDVPRLYPRVVPPLSYVAAIGLVLLLTLNFVPLPFADNSVFSEPAPPALTEAERLLEEIEGLLLESGALETDEVREEFQILKLAFTQNSGEGEAGRLEIGGTDDLIAQIQSLLLEGNLTTSQIYEGLSEMGTDLELSSDTAEAGSRLGEADLTGASEALGQLAEDLGAGRTPSDSLQQALEQASQNPRTGLEGLAGQLEQAAEGLRDENAQTAGQALTDASASLGQLSDLLEDQRLKNEAAERMDELRETLEQLNEEAADEALDNEGADTQPDVSGGESTTGSENGEGTGQEPGAEAAEGAGMSADGSQDPAEAGAPEPGATDGGIQEIGSGSGQNPVGFGFSPEQKEGAPTSLEVQLVEEILQAAAMAPAEARDDSESEQPEEATLREQSSLDYRNVPSELTPAQQDLLNQDRIPRQYQNLIKEYFEAIRPPSEP